MQGYSTPQVPGRNFSTRLAAFPTTTYDIMARLGFPAGITPLAAYMCDTASPFVDSLGLSPPLAASGALATQVASVGSPNSSKLVIESTGGSADAAAGTVGFGQIADSQLRSFLCVHRANPADVGSGLQLFGCNPATANNWYADGYKAEINYASKAAPGVAAVDGGIHYQALVFNGPSRTVRCLTDIANSAADAYAAAMVDATAVLHLGYPGVPGACVRGQIFAFYVFDGLLTPAMTANFWAPFLLSQSLILGTGQSLATGLTAVPPVTVIPSARNLMFAGSAIPGGASAGGLGSEVPLIEGPTIGWATPHETMSSALAKRFSDRSCLSIHAVDGYTYAQLAKGTVPYQNGMDQAAAFQQIKGGLGGDILAVTAVHGENDDSSGNLNYQANLVTWQSDYNADLKVISGQPRNIPMFHSQMSSWTKYCGRATGIVAYPQLAAALSNPGKIVLVGPKYHLPYLADGVHLPAQSQTWMGEEYANAIYWTIIRGTTWVPIYPTLIARVGAAVTVTWNLPPLNTQIVLDTVRVTDPGQYGFEFSDNGAPLAIDSTVIIGTNQTRHTLHAVPSGVNMRFRYAYTGVAGNNAGPTTGARGCLRGNYAPASNYGNTLYPWAVHFDGACP